MASVYVVNCTHFPIDIGNGAPSLVVPGRHARSPLGRKWAGEASSHLPGYLIVDDSITNAIAALPDSDTRKINLGFCTVMASDNPQLPKLLGL